MLPVWVWPQTAFFQKMHWNSLQMRRLWKLEKCIVAPLSTWSITIMQNFWWKSCLYLICGYIFQSWRYVACFETDPRLRSAFSITVGCWLWKSHGKQISLSLANLLFALSIAVQTQRSCTCLSQSTISVIFVTENSVWHVSLRSR